jgi:hypothetical protein
MVRPCGVRCLPTRYMVDSMSELGGVERTLTNDVGPLPAWAWGLIAVAGWLIYEHMAGGASSAVADDGSTDDDSSDDSSGDSSDDGTDDSGDGSGDVGDVTAGTVTGASAGGVVVGTYTTNQQWLIAAIDALRAEGLPAGPVTTALTRYIHGEKVTAKEAGYVNAAISAIGPPPTPRQIFPTTTATPTKPTKKPTKPKPKKPKPRRGKTAGGLDASFDMKPEDF